MAEVLETPERPSSTARRVGRYIITHENFAIGIALAIVMGVLGVISRLETLTPTNLGNVLLQSSVRGVAALGQAFVILTANIDLSVAGVGVMTMMLGAAMMTTEWQNIVVAFLGRPASPALALPVMLIVGICWGLLNGTLVTRLGIPSLIATFGVWQIGYGLSYYVTRGEALTELPASLAIFGSLPVAPIIFFPITIGM